MLAEGMASATHMGKLQAAALAARYPRIKDAVEGWKLTAYQHNRYVKWTHPALPVALEAMPYGHDASVFGITVGLHPLAVKIETPRTWDDDAFQNVVLAVLAAVVANEDQTAGSGRHGLVEIIETSEDTKASWGPLLRYHAVCECGWKSGECYPKPSASAAHQDHVLERCGAR